LWGRRYNSGLLFPEVKKWSPKICCWTSCRVILRAQQENAVQASGCASVVAFQTGVWQRRGGIRMLFFFHFVWGGGYLVYVYFIWI